MNFKSILTMELLILVFLAVPVSSQPDLHWQVISSGGTKSASTGIQLDLTIGQTTTTFSSGGSRSFRAGYWQNFECCQGVRGDINGDGTHNSVLDMSYLIETIFRGGPTSPCPQEADLNSDGNPATILDLTFIVDDIFRGGPAPGGC